MGIIELILIAALAYIFIKKDEIFKMKVKSKIKSGSIFPCNSTIYYNRIFHVTPDHNGIDLIPFHPVFWNKNISDKNARTKDGVCPIYAPFDGTIFMGTDQSVSPWNTFAQIDSNDRRWKFAWVHISPNSTMYYEWPNGKIQFNGNKIIRAGRSALREIKKGEILGYVGMVGIASAPHVHFITWRMLPHAPWIQDENPRVVAKHYCHINSDYPNDQVKEIIGDTPAQQKKMEKTVAQLIKESAGQDKKSYPVYIEKRG